MGILYDSMKLQKQMKRDMIIERLVALGVTTSQTGQSVYEMEYGDLKILWVLSEMRQVDIDHPDHKWFR